jgi:ribosome-associated protein
MPTSDIRKQVAHALEAVHNKKAEDVSLLQLPGESSTFTDYFLICSGSNPRQVQAIADEVDERLSKDMGVEPNAREGYQTAEWILLDYVDFVVHIFNAQRRAYYDLERLWKSAHKLTAEELLHPAAGHAAPAEREMEVPRAKKKPAKKAAKKVPGVRAAAKASARGAGAKKAPARKTAARKTAARKTAAKKSAVKKTAGKKASAKKTVKKAAKKSVAKKSGTKRK